MANSNFFDDFDDYISYDEQSDENSTYLISVTQLNEYVEGLLNNDALLRKVSIEGEISGFKRYYASGHCYFMLKDSESAIKCVMFKSYASRLKISPSDGMRVVITGNVSLYTKDGSYQFYVKSMRSVGEGELYAEYLKLKERLEREGLFSQEHKKLIPYLPLRIGVATSRSGAVLHDIMSVARRRFPGMDIVFCHTSVQGVNAPKEIVSALQRLDSSKLCDVIILARGGGSMEDLWCFNDEMVARAIYECETPVISAVGHETDYTIADFAADIRAATPSAAAELAVPLLTEIEQSLVYYMQQAESMARKKLSGFSERLNILQASLVKPADYVKKKRERLLELEKRAYITANAKLAFEKQRLEGAAQTAQSLSPLNVLMRGYTVVKDYSGSVIKSAKDLVKAGRASVVFDDGSVCVTVDDINDER